MAAFALEDVCVKAASVTLPVAQILLIFGLGGALLFALKALYNRESLFSPDVVSRPMRWRVLFEIVGRLFYVLAIALTPLSSATVILQATPLVVVAGAALVFGEHVSWSRWGAILLGLLGVIIIIRPGSESFSGLSVLAVLGMIGFAGRDLASRAAPRSLSPFILGLYGFLSVAIAGALYAIWEQRAFIWPDSNNALYLSAAVLSGVAAYYGLMKAMRTGEVSAVTPFRYTRLLFGIGFGVLWFGEQLSLAMIIGSGMIVISGLSILYKREE